MALLPPRHIGPLAECRRSVRVQSQLTGSTVTVFTDGAVVGSGIATWSGQTFQLNGSPAPGQQVTAPQSLGLDLRRAPPPRRPSAIGGVGFRSHFNQCGTCVWLAPGSETNSQP